MAWAPPTKPATLPWPCWHRPPARRVWCPRATRALPPSGCRKCWAGDAAGMIHQLTDLCAALPRVLPGLRNRGFEDILVDGLKAFPAAIEVMSPHTEVQACIVHLMRQVLSSGSGQDHKAMVTRLRPVPRGAGRTGLAAPEGVAASALDRKCPTIALSSRAAGRARLHAPAEIWRIIQTTNLIKSLNSKLRTVVRSCGQFRSHEAAVKPIYLVRRRVKREWIAATNQFVILFADRFIDA